MISKRQNDRYASKINWDDDEKKNVKVSYKKVELKEFKFNSKWANYLSEKVEFPE